MKLKIIFYLVIFIILLSCNGFIYPKVDYILIPKEDNPPFSVNDRFELGSVKDDELAIYIVRAGNEFKNRFYMSAFVKKPYRKLSIDKISYKIDAKEGLLFENIDFDLPQSISKLDEERENYSFVTKNDEFYWCNLIISNKKPSVNFYRFFKEFRVGSTLDAEIIIQYKFDDEKTKIQIFHYTIQVRKGKYISPFMGW